MQQHSDIGARAGSTAIGFTPRIRRTIASLIDFAGLEVRTPALSARTIERVRAQQVDMLFRNVTLGVLGAGAANLILVLILRYLSAIDGIRGVAWPTYILTCMVAHLLLLWLYRRHPFDEARWKPWALVFTTISFIEGVGWGWAPAFLDETGRPEIQMLILCVTLVVATGAVPAFGSYLPAFFALFFPATLPYMAVTLVTSDPMIHATAYLMPIYILMVAVLGFQTTRNLKELVTLRITSGELAEHLRSQIELVEQANMAKSSFLAAASHDLRQPVHAIGLCIGVLREMPLPDAADRLTRQIENSVSALDALFGALLDISRLDSRSVEVHNSAFPITPVLQRIRDDFATEAAAKAITIRAHACSSMVLTDRLLLERILRNIVSNAVRYTRRGRVVIGCRRRGERVEIQVWDTGVGIAPQHQQLIFKEYFQVGNPERDREKGLGLGLAIVQRLANLLDSSLAMRSTIGRGSCFSVSIPIARTNLVEAFPLSVPIRHEFQGALIAVVDDEAPILLGITALLEGWGYVVVAGESGADIVSKLANCPLCPDLLISDHWLRMNETGFDVIDRLRMEFNEDIPAMLISGDTGPELQQEATAFGVLLLHKPTPNGRLRAAVANTLAASARRPKSRLDALGPQALRG